MCYSDKLQLFKKLYETIEEGSPVSVELQEAAHSHGIDVEAVERIALASLEDDIDE